jgi:pyrroloquinoline-quinone synthase
VNFWDRLEAVRDARDVLRHPFYVRWSEGALARAELAHYSGQYRHAVVALAAAAESAATSPDAGDDAVALARHADEEGLACGALGRVCRRYWRPGRRRGDPRDARVRLCMGRRAVAFACRDARAMFAIEAAQPAISATKQTGLVRHHGLARSPYFDVHQELDIEHAEQTREMISRRWEQPTRTRWS